MKLAALKNTSIDILHTPPKGVRTQAAYALRLAEKWDRGGTEKAKVIAQALAQGSAITSEQLRAAYNYFRTQAHHVSNDPVEDGGPSAVKITWGMFGGDAGFRWARKVLRKSKISREHQARSSFIEDNKSRLDHKTLQFTHEFISALEKWYSKQNRASLSERDIGLLIEESSEYYELSIQGPDSSCFIDVLLDEMEGVIVNVDFSGKPPLKQQYPINIASKGIIKKLDTILASM